MSASDADVLRESMFAQAEMIHALRARVAELEKDAARYRWWRDHGQEVGNERASLENNLLPDGEQFASIDAAIDAAMVDALPETPTGAAPDKA